MKFLSGVKVVYADGGLIGQNPSALGGTWAYRLLSNTAGIIEEKSGIVTPETIGLPTITNNLTEMYAVLMAFECLPNGWNGHVYTDSNVTRLRLENVNAKMNGLTKAIIELIERHRSRFGEFKVTLLDGHPTRAQLLLGKGKRGNLVSEHNVACDRMCCDQAKEFLQRIHK